MLEPMTCKKCLHVFPTWYNMETKERWYQSFKKMNKNNLKRKRKLKNEDYDNDDAAVLLKLPSVQELLCLTCQRETSFIALTEKNALDPNKFAYQPLADLYSNVREILKALNLVPYVLDNLIVEYLSIGNELWYMFLAYKEKKNNCVESLFFIPANSSLLHSFSVELYEPSSKYANLLDLNISQNVLQTLYIDGNRLVLRQLNLDELSLCTRWTLVEIFRKPKWFHCSYKASSVSVVWDERNQKLWLFDWSVTQIWSIGWHSNLPPWREGLPIRELVEESITASKQEKKMLFSSMTMTSSALGYFYRTPPLHSAPPFELAWSNFHCVLEAESEKEEKKISENICETESEKIEMVKKNSGENKNISIDNHFLIRIKHHPCNYVCIKDCSLYLDTIITKLTSSRHQNCFWYFFVKVGTK